MQWTPSGLLKMFPKTYPVQNFLEHKVTFGVEYVRLRKNKKFDQ